MCVLDLQVFSRIAIMSRGELVFCGQPEEMVDFFSQCGYECPEYCNPFDTYGIFLVQLYLRPLCAHYHIQLKCAGLDRVQTVDFTSVDTHSSEREAATFSRMHEITSSYQRSAIYQNMLDKMEQSLQLSDKSAIPFKSKDSPNGAAKLEVLFRSVPVRTTPHP